MAVRMRRSFSNSFFYKDMSPLLSIGHFGADFTQESADQTFLRNIPGRTNVQGKMGDKTLEPVDFALKYDPKNPNECVVTYGELDAGVKMADIKITQEKQPDESIIVKFKCKNLFHNSGPIPGAIWKDLDKGQKPKQDGVFCKWTLKKGNHETMPDLKKYFEV